MQLDSAPPAGSALIVSENYFPGWTAAVDGRAALVDRAEYNLIGVQLPAGARQVSLRFDDPAYERGKVITLLALVASLILVAVGVVRGRTRDPA